MESKEQRAILKARKIVLGIVDAPNGSLADRLKAAERDVKVLGAAIALWVDKTSLMYQYVGCDQDEWREDIRAWFAAQQFYVDDDVNDGTMLRCHLNNVGWGRHVILSFRLGGAKKKGTNRNEPI